MSSKKSTGMSDQRVAAAELDRAVMRTGIVVWKSSAMFESLEGEGTTIVKLVFKAPVGEGDDWLCVITADDGTDAVVGFHRDVSFRECLEGILNRIQNRSVVWKPDSYR